MNVDQYDQVSRPEADPYDSGRSAEWILRHLTAPSHAGRTDARGCEALRARFDLCSQVLSALAPSSPIHERLI